MQRVARGHTVGHMTLARRPHRPSLPSLVVRSTADDPPLHGPQLMQRLQELQDALPLDHFPPGTRVW